MQKINFQNLPNTTSPVNATNLNQVQTNVENAINDKCEYAILNGKRKDITGNTAWNTYDVNFDNNDEFSTSNANLFERTTTGIKCKFSGSVLIIRAMTLGSSLNDKEFDIIDDYRTYYSVKGVNKDNYNVKTVSSNEIIKITYIGDATSFTMYNSRIIVIKLN